MASKHLLCSRACRIIYRPLWKCSLKLSNLHPGGLPEHSQSLTFFPFSPQSGSPSPNGLKPERRGHRNPKSSSIPKFHSIHLPETKAGSPQAHKNVRALKTLSHPQLIPPDWKPMWFCGLDSQRYRGQWFRGLQHQTRSDIACIPWHKHFDCGAAGQTYSSCHITWCKHIGDECAHLSQCSKWTFHPVIVWVLLGLATYPPQFSLLPLKTVGKESGESRFHLINFVLSEALIWPLTSTLQNYHHYFSSLNKQVI